jgi:HEAT repeat protein
MSDNGDEIAAEARRLIREIEFNPQRFLRGLDEGWYTEAELSELPAEQRALLVPALQAMLPNRTGKIRLNVARALLELGDPLGWQTFRECLSGDDAALCLGALERLIKLPHDPQKRGYKAPIDADAVIEALERPLASADSRTRDEAVSVLKWLKTPRAFDRLAQLVGDERPDVRMEAAICLGDAGYDRGALTVIAEMLQVKGHAKRYFLVRALEHLCGSSDADTRARAAEVAVEDVDRALAAESDSELDTHHLANDIWHCMDGIAAAGSSHEQDLLRRVLGANAAAWIRGMALKRLAQLEGRDGISRLLNALSDADLWKDALEGLAALARGSQDPAVREFLAQRLARETPEDISSLVKAFLAFGGDATTGVLDEIAARADADTAMMIHWARRNITPRAAAAMLTPACGGRALSEEAIEKIEAKWLEEFNASSAVHRLLDGWHRITAILRKGVVLPADHAEDVRCLAHISRDRFPIDEAVQKAEADGNFSVLLVHRDQGFSFPVENYGRWCNLDAVLDGLNGILERLGLAERFIELGEKDCDAIAVVFVHADIFLKVARELRIALVERPALRSD